LDRRPLLPIVLAIAVASLWSATTAAASSPVRVVSPKVDAFVTGAPVTVKLKVSKAAGRPQVTVNGKRVDKSLKKVGSGAWAARLGAGQAVAGTNRLVASVGVGKGRRHYASSRFVVGKRDRSLLTVSGPRAGAAAVAAQVKASGRPRLLSAKLNGKRLRWPLGLVPAQEETLALGGDDGLHFGVNHLRVMAVGKGDRFDVERRKITVPRDRPLAGAGADRRVAAGQQVRLDGRHSRSARAAGAGLSYRWKIVSRPSGSKARLEGASSPRPTLPTDEPGFYEVRLTVTEPGADGKAPASSSDVLSVTSIESVPPIGIPIQTMVPNGRQNENADSGIRVGGETFWLGAPEGNVAQAVVIDRETLKVLYHATYKSEAETVALRTALSGFTSQPLVVISVPDLQGSTPKSSLLAADLLRMGVELPPAVVLRSGWSAIGLWETKEGGTLGLGANVALTNGADYGGDVSGYLQRSERAGFVFVPGDRVAFETDAPGTAANANKIVVGSAEYPSLPLPACGVGGFQIQEVAAETLAPGESGTFVTNGCGAASEATEQGNLGEVLKGLVEEQASGAGAGPHLVFVQSIGSPYGAGGGAAWNKIATAIEALGGTASVFAAARSSYSFVGGVGITPQPRTEASETLTGVRAAISGVLKPNLASAYSPELFSPNGATTFPLSAIAYQQPQAWPDSKSAADRAALAYIAEDVLKLEKPTLGNSCYVPTGGVPDVRSEYCNEGYNGLWGRFATKLEKAKFVPGHGFGKTEWEEVAKQLYENEFEAVQRVWSMVQNMQNVFGVASGTGEVDLSHIATVIEKALSPPPGNLTLGWWMELVGNLSSTGSYFGFYGDDEKLNAIAQKSLGVLQGIMFEGSSSLFESNGEPFLDRFKVEAQDLATELSTRYVEDSKGAAKVGEILVSDYGKLRAMEASGMLGYNAESYDKAIEAVQTGVEGWSYENLIPTAYEAVKLEGGGPAGPLKNAAEYQCEAGSGRLSFPYNPFAQIPGAEYRIEQPAEAFGVLVKIGSALPREEGPEEKPLQPTAETLEPLIKPAHGTLGYFAPWWWRYVYHFPSSKTRSTFC
jgi:hypothetical protein